MTDGSLKGGRATYSAVESMTKGDESVKACAVAQKAIRPVVLDRRMAGWIVRILLEAGPVFDAMAGLRNAAGSSSITLASRDDVAWMYVSKQRTT